MSSLCLDNPLRRIRETNLTRRTGKVTQVVGLVVEGQGPPAALGETCWIDIPGQPRRAAEVVGFRDSRTLLMPLGPMDGIGPGQTITASGQPLNVPVGPGFLGRVVDGWGQPLDSKGPIGTVEMRSLSSPPPDPMKRERVKDVLPLGVRAVDGLLTCGRGQRMGIFGGSGVGKSTLLGMFARNTRADLNVIALIGERGREVRDFLEKDLGPEGLRRSVIIVATSDQPALVRIKAAYAAATMAEYFRDRGQNVLFMMDSVTRLCLAQREIGLAVGEPPTTRGYTPSVFSQLPRYLERSGMGEKGSITGLYTVLVEGDDMNEPVADAVRSILDGHIVLSRDLAAANHFPSIDCLSSASRIFPDITSPEHKKAAARLRHLMSVYTKARDLLDVGAYVAGSNADLDIALKIWPKVLSFLHQTADDPADFSKTVQLLRDLSVTT